MTNEEKQFMRNYANYQQKSFQLITLLHENLNPNLPGDKAAEINKLFHDVCDSMDQVQSLGEKLVNQVKFPVTLAN